MPGQAALIALRCVARWHRAHQRGVYREVTPDRIVFSYAWEDANGNPGHEMHVTITLEEIGTRTRMTLRQTGFESRA
jgi:uncharacterized protein YndB with AHSA1/START domain